MYVVLKNTKYELAKSIDDAGLFTVKTVDFKDDQKAHRTFWAVYERPPKQEYWGYIIERRDLLAPQDIRERKGSFFTPQIWVEKSQQYLADVLGENWQDEFYIWDCCAGTGNLLNGLTNYRNVWASTLDKADVDVMQDRILNGWKMFENHVFQFDFLNDDFSKCPGELQKIINDPEKRKKLVIYINPPYAEAANARTITGTGQNRTDVAVKQKTYSKYIDKIGIAGRELFAQFFIRIYAEIPGCILGEFSKLKILQAPNFREFRNVFKAKLLKMFAVPAWTFDNVKGSFPIGFFIWDTDKKEVFTETISDVFSAEGESLGTKTIFAVNKNIINKWLHEHFDNSGEKIGWLRFVPNDFQNNAGVYITIKPNESDVRESRIAAVTKNNMPIIAIYLAVRHCIEHSWLNHNDQFLYPADDWKEDFEFQSDCLIFTLFHGKNNISAEQGQNNWIPFTEEQTGCRKAFKSHFMSDFIAGKIQPTEEKEGEQQGLFEIFKEKETAFNKVVFFGRIKGCL